MLPSFADALFTDTVAASLALIVPVPVVALELRLIPPGKPPEGADNVTVNVSAPSAKTSFVVATVNVSVRSVASAANVTLPVVFVKSACTAVSLPPTLVAKSTTTCAPGRPDRVTVNVTLLPSFADALFTDTVAASLALIVPTPVESLMLTPVGKLLDGSVRVTVNVSAPSARASSVAATVNVCIRSEPDAPDANVTVPLALVKSDDDAVSPVSTLVA